MAYAADLPKPEAYGPGTGFFTDLVSAPEGAWVTVHGAGFGSQAGQVTLAGMAVPVVSWNDRTIVIRVPTHATSGTLEVGGQAFGLAVHSGRVIEVTPRTLHAAIVGLRPGDALYLRSGIYSGTFDDNVWNESNITMFSAGTAAKPVSIAAFPGEVATLKSNVGTMRPNFYLGNAGGGQVSAYLTIAGLHLLTETECVHGGGDGSGYSASKTGASHIRFVANECDISDSATNSMSGMLSIQGDDWKVLGNVFHDPANRTVFNNNHAIYVQNGVDNIEIAYNELRGLHMGHVIQVHQDGKPKVYHDIVIHDNMLVGDKPADMRGITVSNVSDDSTVIIRNNLLKNLGQDFSAIAVYRGSVEIRNNELIEIYAPHSGAIMLAGQMGGSRHVDVHDNLIATVADTPYLFLDLFAGVLKSQVRLDNNRYCGGGELPAADQHAHNCR